MGDMLFTPFRVDCTGCTAWGDYFHKLGDEHGPMFCHAFSTLIGRPSRNSEGAKNPPILGPDLLGMGPFSQGSGFFWGALTTALEGPG